MILNSSDISRRILIPDLWNIVLQYLDDDVKPETSEFFEKHLDKIHLYKINWEGLSGNTNIVKQEIRTSLLQSNVL